MMVQYESPPRTPDASQYLQRQIEHNSRKLAHKWDPEHSLAGYEEKVWNYATRHKVSQPKDLLDDKPKGDEGKGEEILILDRVRTEGKQRENMTNSEKATVDVIESGNRSFLDFALDEVERFKRLDPAGALAAKKFDWKACGDHHDIPPLRRSLGEHSVRTLKGDDFINAFNKHAQHKRKDKEKQRRLDEEEEASRELQEQMFSSANADFETSFRPNSAKRRSSRRRLPRNASAPQFSGAGAVPSHASQDVPRLPRNLIGKEVRVRGRWATVELDCRPKDNLVTVHWREPWPEDRSVYRVVPLRDVHYEKPEADECSSPPGSASASPFGDFAPVGQRQRRPKLRSYEARAAESVREERLKFGTL